MTSLVIPDGMSNAHTKPSEVFLHSRVLIVFFYLEFLVFSFS